MKKIATFLGILLLSISDFSQTTLTFERHALRPGDVQVMHRASFVEAGPGGAGLIWNFSALEFTGEERNNILDATTVKKYGIFPSSNVAINTGTDGFHSMFRITSTGNENIGHFGENFHVVLTQPQRRMIYPFSFGNFHSSTFSGYGVYGNATTDIVGDYSFEADAWGTLILPNNILTNVLRVRHTLSRYEFAMCFASETHQTRYLFYTENVRYPVFAILETMRINNNRDTSWHRSAAVNEFVRTVSPDQPIVATERPSIERREYIHSVFPNPFSDEINVNFTLEEQTNVSVELFTLEGLRVREILSRRVLEQGVHQFTHNTSDLPSGVYFVKFTFNDFAFVKQTIKIR
ncbi:MAG: T9SS type A sorting domain-containing protein [Bacteroidales bacterium]|nr:T9SS type A sorting domain-containing protein [Bacteroidales bacterium]